MGFDSIEPYLRHAGKGVILLCRTSNPGGADLQAQRLAIRRAALRAHRAAGRRPVEPQRPARPGRRRHLPGRDRPRARARADAAAADPRHRRAGRRRRGDGARRLARRRQRDHGADHRQLVARRALSPGAEGADFALAARQRRARRHAPSWRAARPYRSSAERRMAAAQPRTAPLPPAAVAGAGGGRASPPRCWPAAALGLLFEVGGLPARPALGLLTLGAGVGPGGERAARCASSASACATPSCWRAARDDALRLVADWYWEQDREFRFTYISEPAAPARPRARSTGSSAAPPWELPNIGMSEAQLDRAPRRPRGAPAVHRPARAPRAIRRAAARLHSISGEPRFDAGGRVRRLLGRRPRRHRRDPRRSAPFAASETRYRELFERSPSPSVLHRDGVVFDANPSAARLFGFADAEAMKGMRMARACIRRANRGSARSSASPGSSSCRSARACRCATSTPGTVDGRPISVQATGVARRGRRRPGDAVASASTSPSAAAPPRRRCAAREAMLSHLFATSPDCIALTECRPGRYAMVNAAFSALTGYAADEVVGRTADRARPLARRRATARRLRAGARRRGPHRRDAGAHRRQAPARLALGADLGGALRRWTGATTWCVNARDVTATERTRLEHEAILERASIGIALTRDRRFVQANPRFEAMFGWPAGRAASASRAGGLADDDDYAEIGELAGPLLAARPAVRDRARDDAARRQPLLVPPARPGGRPGSGRAKAARSGSPKT